MQNISNKNVVITGASSGIGESTAKILAKHKANIALVARREDKLRIISEEIAKNCESRIIYQVADVSNFRQVQNMTDNVIKEFGNIDVLINNAGIMFDSPLSLCEIDEWDKTIDTNIKGVLYGVASVMPKMLAQGSGHIVNISSICGRKVFEGLAVYCATKHAVHAISESIRIESDDKIRSTIIAPGKVNTEIMKNNIQKTNYETLKKNWERDNAMNPEEIANAVFYAVSQPDTVDINEILIRPLHQNR